LVENFSMVAMFFRAYLASLTSGARSGMGREMTEGGTELGDAVRLLVLHHDARPGV
jgi:hypothetical protein